MKVVLGGGGVKSLCRKKKRVAFCARYGKGKKEDIETDRKQPRLHPPASFLITIQPPFRPPNPRIFAKDIPVPMHDPRIHPHHRPAWEVSPAHRRTLGRDDTFERQAEGRVQAPGFFDAGVEIGEGARFFEWEDEGSGRGRWEGGGVELGEEAG